MKTNKPKNKQKKPSKLVPLVAVLAAVGASALAFCVHQTLFAATDRPAKTLIVGDGDTYQSLLVQNLWQNKPWASRLVARLYLRYFVSAPLKKGSYALPKSASFRQAVQILTQPPKNTTVKLQLIEGKNLKELFWLVQTTQGIRPTLFVEQDKTQNSAYTWSKTLDDSQKVAQALGVTLPKDGTAPLEGRFAPDTYYFATGTTDVQVLKKLYDTQSQRLAAAWQSRQEGLPYKTADELLVMASIVEKETGVAQERPEVAAVFVNRLRQGMRLQTDPTIVYGLFDRYDGKIYKKDIAERTAYNTYQMDGLPPTPIAMPSKAAIEAAAHPAQSQFLYFVATGQGGHAFSKTLQEHNQAVARYRQITQGVSR